MSESIPDMVRANMKRIRKAKGLTQDSMGELMGVQPSHYNRIELGKVDPGIVTVAKVAKALGVPIAELFVPHDADALRLADKLRRIEQLPEEERRAVEAVINMALERHPLS